EKNEFFLPEFQRGYRWTSGQVKKYFQSLYRGYPSGAFLIWKAEAPSKLKGSTPSGEQVFTRLILDGQQRLTTLYTILKGVPPNWIEGKPPRTDLYFSLETEEFQYYAATLMSGKPEWISVVELLQKGVGPFVGQASPEVSAYLMTHFEKLTQLDEIKKYEYYLQEIDLKDPIQVVEIFNLVNSAGTPLSDADLALALITGRWEDCKDKMRFAIDRYSQHGFHFSMEFFTRCIAVIATGRGTFRDVHKLSTQDYIDAWVKTERSLDYLINVLPTHAYIDETSFLSTQYIFFPLVYFLAHNNFKFPDAKTRDKSLYWLYNALMWGRYSTSSESKLDQDIRALRDTNSVDALIKHIATARGGNLEISGADLEFQGVRSRFYQIFYILIRQNGAADWADPSLPLYNNAAGNRYAIERHHIFPKSKLYTLFSSKSSYDKSLVNELANIALLTSETNHSIFNNDPEIYLADINSSLLKQQFVPTQLELWALTKDAYNAFLKERRRRIAKGINVFLDSLYQGRPTVSASQEADRCRRQVEETEAALRNLILSVAKENEEDIHPKAYIPGHITAKLEGRIKKYLKDHPADFEESCSTLEKQLQFFDVSEYCELISSKDNWPYFEPYFGHKGSLQNRFSQLQKLRNTLAHNRDLTEVVIKDGEAAMLWFSGVLNKLQQAAES
ncbi:MAG: DUF262 domain-containing protein, partial [Cyanobacteria bacterium J06627_28]